MLIKFHSRGTNAQLCLDSSVAVTRSIQGRYRIFFLVNLLQKNDKIQLSGQLLSSQLPL